MKFKLTAVFLILITSIAVPSYSDDVDEAPMSQERYDSLTDGAKAIIEEYGKKDCEDEYDGIFTVLNHAVTKLRVGRNDGKWQWCKRPSRKLSLIHIKSCRRRLRSRSRRSQ